MVARAPAEADRVALIVYDHGAADHGTSIIALADGGSVTIGRSRSADIVIDSERVSRIHATFRRVGHELEVVDEGSRNGTSVNGAVITGPRRLASGDEVVVGPASVVVSLPAGVVRPRLEGTRYLDERLGAEVDRGLHHQRQFGLALLALDGPAEAVDLATELICGVLRPMEAIAEYAPGMLAIVMPELDLASTQRAVTTLVRRLGTVGSVTTSVGVASFPEHSTTAGGLLSRARAALELGQQLGDGTVATPPADASPALDDVVVADPRMRQIHEQLRRVAEHLITVLICGETGVGKEVIATAIHGASERRAGPLVRINCASLPESLLESELFGHERGAFTGADRRKTGYFEAAHGGTLFLDEIGEMTPGLQAKLLRVLEQRRITRVGGTDEIEVDVRVICATHRDLEAECRQSTFRADLYFRISAFTIVVPPLRDRPQELEQLARAFIDQHAVQLRRAAPVLSAAAMDALRQYAWPGNVRELRNAIQRAMILCTGTTIGLEDLPDAVRETRLTAVAGTHEGRGDIRLHLAQLEREALASALDAAHGNQTEAAKQLGITRRTLIYRMEKHGLKPLPPAKRDVTDT